MSARIAVIWDDGLTTVESIRDPDYENDEIGSRIAAIHAGDGRTAVVTVVRDYETGNIMRFTTRRSEILKMEGVGDIQDVLLREYARAH